MSAFTRLERAVMAALAADLRDEIPELARLFSISRLDQRRNTGFGLFTGMRRADDVPPPGGPTGDFGTVHAMVGKLADPVAFKVRLRNGALIGLYGDSYGQDTRSIDFATVGFDQVFTVDESGQSIPFDHVEPTGADHSPPPPTGPRYAPATPPRASPAPATPAPARPTPAPARTGVRPQKDPLIQATGPLVDLIRASQSPDARKAVAAVLDDTRSDPLPDMTREEKTSLLVGLWVALAAGVAIAVLALDVPPGLALVVAFVLGRGLQTPRGLALVRRAMAAWKAVSAASSG